MRRSGSTVLAILALVLGGCARSSGESPEEPVAPSRSVPRQSSAPPERDEGAAPGGTEDWRLRRPAHDHQIEGYLTAASGPPGTRLGLKVSTTERGYRVSAYRIGAYHRGSGHLMWRSRFLPGRQQGEPAWAAYDTRTVVAPWRRDLTMDTADWPPGFYVVKLRTGSGWEAQIPYLVSSPSARGTVALVAPVTTWQAYNTWGGYSLYHGPSGDRRAWAVSFDRPYAGVLGANDFRTALVPVVVRAEELGIRLSWFTNLDVHAHPERFAGARGYVSIGHDEYWTSRMRRHVLHLRDAGTNLAFLGANTMYWRIRLEDTATGPLRRMVGYRHDAHLDPRRETDPRGSTARFRDPPAAMAENDLVGMLYECYPVDTDYVVASPDWWGFRGTGARAGTRVPGLVGPESDRVYPDARTPRPLQVLSHSTFPCRGVTTSTQSTYYSVPSGAGVFTAGTLRWGCALVDRCERPLGRRTSTFVRVVTGNLLRVFAAGPTGIRHPARDNVARFALPLENSVSAS